ncbi:hypothetical protein NQ315_015903 [Exocentrus adspersus]|uniref:Anoctamin n=1 Tax=Exocentrus adspersus TaxID=1586481 RepID=A0AAV8W461_9CUCU|nr:hypothetical protein NQ315_015903 [Exocentrus adspersus]
MYSHSEGSSSSLQLQEETASSTNFNSHCSGDEEDPFISSLWGIHKTLDALRGNMSKQHLEAANAIDDHSDAEEATLPPTYIVLQVSPAVPEITLKWLIEKINGNKRDGGGELVVMKQPYNPDAGYILHLSASRYKFLEVAEELDLIKRDSKGQMREFTVAQLDDFLVEGMHVDDLLTMAEKQNIVLHELENIRALAEDLHIPGYPTSGLYESQSIFQACQEYGIVTGMFPMHDEEAVKKLWGGWFGFLVRRPFEEVRIYFGEAIAMYFHFLAFYTYALSIPVLLGVLQWLLLSVETLPFFCAINVVWVIVFLVMWKRRSNELAFEWGTIGMTSMDEPRPNFRGAMGVDAITGKIQPQSPRYMTYVKMLGSFAVVIVCMAGASVVMFMSFWAEDYVKNSNPENQVYLLLPSVVYSVVVFVMDTFYRRLATFLTEWENHRTQSQFERHRVSKLVLFEFVNNFLSLFYIAFVIRDMGMLRSQLLTMLIISQTINNFQETVLPLAHLHFTIKVHELKRRFLKKPCPSQPKVFRDDDAEPKEPLSYIKIPAVQQEDSRIKQAEYEANMEAYESTYDDYLELFIQFGYVFLFSSVYPAAAFWAFASNVVEIACDGFKLCRICQRPISRKVKDIGAWQVAFEVVGALSIITNCGLLYLSPQIRSLGYDYSETKWLFLFVVLEHALLGFWYLVRLIISDKPEWVRVGLAKKNYQSKQALKFEVRQRGPEYCSLWDYGNVIFRCNL